MLLKGLLRKFQKTEHLQSYRGYSLKRKKPNWSILRPKLGIF